MYASTLFSHHRNTNGPSEHTSRAPLKTSHFDFDPSSKQQSIQFKPVRDNARQNRKPQKVNGSIFEIMGRFYDK